VATLYWLSVCLHVLAAIVWIGGMFFLVLVVVPWLRKGGRAQAPQLLRDTGRRFRTVGWVCFAILLVTGTFNLWVRGVRLQSFVDPRWLASDFGQAVLAKLALFAVVLALSAVHDFVVGPMATELMRTKPGSPEALRLRKRASWMGRLNVLLALALVGVAVSIVRGWP
jgi:putative copper resistance protein D